MVSGVFPYERAGFKALGESPEERIADAARAARRSDEDGMRTRQARQLGVLGIALCAVLTAAPTPSARVVQVRVGNHPTFTRVVFELDGRAGYRIERSESELVVTLDAASAERSIKSGGPLVAGVTVEPGDQGAVAHVRLRRATPLVKEMLLANPPRIVLDLVLPEPAVAKATPKPAATPAPKPAVAEKPTPKPEVAEKPPAPAPKPLVAEKPPAPAPRPEVAEEPAPKPAVAEKPAPAPRPALAEVPPPPKPAATAQPPAPIPSVAEKPPVPTPTPAVAEKPPAPMPPVAEKPPAPAPTVAAKPGAPASAREPERRFGLDWASWSSKLSDSRSLLPLGLVAAAAVVFLGVVVRVMRRRSRETPLDVLETAREAGAPPLAPAEDDGAFGGFERTTVETGRPTEPVLPVAGPGLFDDEAEKETEMDMGAGLSIEREPMTRPAAMPAAATGGSELDALVRQLEKRMAQLETRLDEANAARERLERQVAAQSEELRVQRAAIARTQRALRGMTRGGEEQATEPALRDPSKPSPGRGSA
jgi:hypothetical protein